MRSAAIEYGRVKSGSSALSHPCGNSQLRVQRQSQKSRGDGYKVELDSLKVREVSCDVKINDWLYAGIFRSRFLRFQRACGDDHTEYRDISGVSNDNRYDDDAGMNDG